MQVIIAEKPSVAREIAAIVRATNRKDGFIEGNGYAVTWAFGDVYKRQKGSVPISTDVCYCFGAGSSSYSYRLGFSRYCAFSAG